MQDLGPTGNTQQMLNTETRLKCSQEMQTSDARLKSSSNIEMQIKDGGQSISGRLESCDRRDLKDSSTSFPRDTVHQASL
jgi:hypothetical protein